MPTREFVQQLETRRDTIRDRCEAILNRVKSRGDDVLTPEEDAEVQAHIRDLKALSERIVDERAELQRARLPEHLANLGTATHRHGARPNAASALTPPLSALPDEELRSAYTRARRGESVALERRDFTTGVPLLPAELFPQPTFPRHEWRLLDRLPGYALEVPSLEYIQMLTKTGVAAIVGEGQPKPEISMPATKLVCTALKLACHAGISWENMLDYEAFSNAVRVELMRDVIDLENSQLWGGDPTAGGLNSLTKTAGILTFTATGGGGPSPEYFTDLAGAIATLRTGPALAEPDLCLMHPNTWATVRTGKDQYGRFLAMPDPTAEQAESIWGIDVLVSTRFTAGEAVLLDTTLMGRVAVREALSIRIGYAGTDFTSNIVRTVVEERLNLAVERPTAIIHVTGLPATAPTTTKTTTAKK
jgi:HK97 family phage major capsid protein